MLCNAAIYKCISFRNNANRSLKCTAPFHNLCWYFTRIFAYSCNVHIVIIFYTLRCNRGNFKSATISFSPSCSRTKSIVHSHSMLTYRISRPIFETCIIPYAVPAFREKYNTRIIIIIAASMYLQNFFLESVSRGNRFSINIWLFCSHNIWSTGLWL